jgi:NADH:ubiquinone oxidoreductase subunit 2 (subunit N)
MGRTGFMNTIFVDRFAIYFFYLFLAGLLSRSSCRPVISRSSTKISGEYYALMLFSVVGMMCMAAGWDLVMIFIGP